jgi:ATP-dependent RNA helicase DHX37/DHR1
MLKEHKTRVLPLYSQLAPDKQYRVFEEASDDARMIVLATNVAETSLTIPGVRYVIDCGKSKEKIFDDRLSMSSFAVQWVSKASAEQRAGRAGRTGPGHCYRLYSAALFGKLANYSKPEILRSPLNQTLLQLKALGIDNILQFPFVTMPPVASIKSSLKQLALL